jgi:hypothetical protein
MDGLKKAADSIEYSDVKYAPIRIFLDIERESGSIFIGLRIWDILLKCFSKIFEIFLCRIE